MVGVTKEIVEEVVKEFRELVDEGRYNIEIGKDNKNYEFIEKYDLKQKQIKNMLKQISVNDCINVQYHYKDKSKVVYKFVRSYALKLDVEMIRVPVYVKFFIGYFRCQKTSVIISFHVNVNIEMYNFWNIRMYNFVHPYIRFF